MPQDRKHQVTQLLEDARLGRSGAVNELFDAVYSELHSLAGNKMRREHSGNLLQTTALVNEAYLRLFGGEPISINGREHFFRLASSAMRRILVDLSRSESASKRGGEATQVSFEDWMAHRDEAPLDSQIDVQGAINSLAELDPRAAQIVNLVLYSGRSNDEIATLLNLTRRTVERDLSAARLYLNRFLSSDHPRASNATRA